MLETKAVEGVSSFDFTGKIYYCGFFTFEIGVVHYDAVVSNPCVPITPSVSMGDFTGGVNHAGLLNSHRWQAGMFWGITGSGWLSRQPPRLKTAQKSRAKKMPVRTLSKVCIFLSSMHPFLGVFN
ncbi:hypothetical protein HMPREF1050_0060 [Haemophilus parahaemolyticus HK385]|uniref:Uncharacterized protein n=1 Tax=Haemophilus parahaemolyticus HK385 TaxID=1095744 RepID=A0ABP2P4K3_HAEPH|nr:hypothetical protein HMPREF1050_0060 [Haemophilus parahaemolyticus HK385]